MPDTEVDAQLAELIKHASDVRHNAYAPHSGYLVGAAVRTSDGAVHVGVNVENASYGMTICAERSAVMAAVAAGAKPGQIVAAAVVTRDGGTPCGACRQVLFEFGEFPVALVRAGEEHDPQVYGLGELLPEGFRLRPLDD